MKKLHSVLPPADENERLELLVKQMKELIQEVHELNEKISCYLSGLRVGCSSCCKEDKER